jgi:hypothetical protein
MTIIERVRESARREQSLDKRGVALALKFALPFRATSLVGKSRRIFSQKTQIEACRRPD